MTLPATLAYREPASRTLATWSPPRVRAALRQMADGDFAEGARLADAVMGDDRVQAVLGTRVNGLLSLPVTFEPARDTARDRKAAKRLEGEFRNIAPRQALSELYMWALMVGAAPAQVLWSMTRDNARPTIDPWSPERLRYDPAERQYVIRTSEGERPLELGTAHWMLVTPFGRHRSHNRALVRALAIPWLAKVYAIGDWSTYSEVHGAPVRAGIAPAGANDDEKRRFRADLANLASDASIVLPEGWDLKLIEAGGKHPDSFEQLIAWADRAITIAVLGQNLTTDVQGGSLAAASVHDAVRNDLLKADAEVLSTAVHDQILTWWAEFNIGGHDGGVSSAPWPRWQTRRPVDEQKKAEADMKRAEALLQFVTAAQKAGVPVDWAAMARSYGLPLLEGNPMRSAATTLPDRSLKLSRDEAAAILQALDAFPRDPMTLRVRLSSQLLGVAPHRLNELVQLAIAVRGDPQGDLALEPRRLRDAILGGDPAPHDPSQQWTQDTRPGTLTIGPPILRRRKA